MVIILCQADNVGDWINVVKSWAQFGFHCCWSHLQCTRYFNLLQRWALVFFCVLESKGFFSIYCSTFGFQQSLHACCSGNFLPSSHLTPSSGLLFHFIWFSRLVLVEGNFLISDSIASVLCRNFGPESQICGFLRIFTPHLMESQICTVSTRIPGGRNFPDCLSVIADFYFVSAQKSLQEQKIVTSTWNNRYLLLFWGRRVSCPSTWFCFYYSLRSNEFCLGSEVRRVFSLRHLLHVRKQFGEGNEVCSLYPSNSLSPSACLWH